MASEAQLYLLADHIKLSLLERQRATSLGLEDSSKDGHISRSLEQMRDGLAALQASAPSDTLQNLQDQYNGLLIQFQGASDPQSASLFKANDAALEADFSHAKSTRPQLTPTTSSLRRSPNTATPSKSVRFRDEETDAANRAALFPYRDTPSAADSDPDASQMSNQQIHVYHANVLNDQDEQLDRLGESIGRQRDLSIQIGNELDDHIQMLDEVDGHVDRHQTRLDQAKRQLGNVSRRAKDNKQLTIIFVLIIILILLIIVLK